MGIKIKNCHIGNCGTGVKAEGKVNMEIDGLDLINNGKDIDLSITEDSLVKLQNVFAKGAKFESITIKEYHNCLEKTKIQVKNISKLDIEEKKFLLKKLKELEKSKDPNIIMRILQELKNSVKSISGKVIINVIVKRLSDIFLNIPLL